MRVPRLGGGLDGVDAEESASEDRVRFDGVELGVRSDDRPRFAPDAFGADDDLATEEAARLAAAASNLARFMPFLAGTLALAGAFGAGSGR